MKRILIVFAVLAAIVAVTACDSRGGPSPMSSNVIKVEEGFVDASGVLIYYKVIGSGDPLVVVHGGPGASHDYFLPYLLPLARTNRLIFIDERGSGRSRKLEDPSGYTANYMVAARGEGNFPYLYGRHPDPNFDPAGMGNMSWDLYRTMWGSSGEFLVDDNLRSVEYADRLGSIHVPTLITVGDHDQVDPSISRDMLARIPGSTLVVLPESGHTTFADQPTMFLKTVDDFAHGAGE